VLRSIKSLNGSKVDAIDGEIGQITDCLFDEHKWTVRYVVVDTGTWLNINRVLVSPYSVTTPLGAEGAVHVTLTQDQVRKSPPPPPDVVAREYESAYAAYYGYPQYWMGSSLWGPGAYPAVPPPEAGGPQGPVSEGGPAAEPGPESHLKSAKAIGGYHIQALDGDIGHVDDLYLDERSWEIRYLLVDTSNWIGGKPVLVSPRWARRLDWIGLKIHLDVPRRQIQDSPEFDASRPISTDYEHQLEEHYRTVRR
jgi:hypothetical protein